MTYFNKFPTGYYILGEYASVVKDVTLRAKFTEIALNNTLFYDTYRVIDTDTPELISYAIYGSPQYHWVILLANNIIDPYTDWPMPDSVFNEWVENKYAYLNETNEQDEVELGADKIKYWIDEDGIVVNESPSAFPMSHRMYEDLMNNKKRLIKIVKPDLLPDLINQFEAAIQK